MTRRDHVRLTDIVEKKLFYVERVGHQAHPLRQPNPAEIKPPLWRTLSNIVPDASRVAMMF